MRKTFAAILAITGVLWFSTVQTRETKQYNENTVSYSSLNKKTQAQVECLAQNVDRKSTRLNSSHVKRSRMPSSA